MNRQLLGQLLFFIPFMSLGQGDNYVLFSKTGDTLITRTSCYCDKKDTLKSYFNILDNVAGNLRLISTFYIEEPGKKTTTCADFKLVSPDTISKYGLYTEGKLGTRPKRFRIKSKVLSSYTATNDKGALVYFRQIRFKFKIGWKTFYSTIVWNTADTEKEKIEYPKIDKIFGNRQLKKYHFVVIIKYAYFTKETGKVTTVNTHTRIIN